MFDIIEKVLSYYVILSKIQTHSSNRIWIRNVIVVEDKNRSRFSRNRNSAFIMSREMQSSRIAASQSIIENVIYSNVRASRRSFMFNILLITKNSQQKNSIFTDNLKDLIFWITNNSVRVLNMIQQIKDEIKKMNKKYNEQCDLIDEFQNERKILQKRITILKNNKLNDKYIIRALRKKLKILETIQNRTRNMRKLITSSFRSSTAQQKTTADINAINAIDRFEKIKRFAVISNSTIFNENKAKFEHWLSIMQNKLEANVDWYSIERMMMTYVNIRFDEETYKHIPARLNKNFTRRYLIVNEIFENLKRVYVDLNKMQTTMNAFIRLTQVNKFVEFHVFWNEIQRLMIKMNLLNHFLLIELKRKMCYRLQNVMSSKFNIVQDIYKLTRLTSLKENHYKRIDDVKSCKRSSAIATVVVEIETKIAINRTVSIITISISIMKKLNRLSLNRQYEISISIVLQILERRIFSERLISIRLKKNSWKRKNISIAMNQIISVKIVRNFENSELSKWAWKTI